MDVYQVSHVPFVVLPWDLARRRRRLDPDLLPGDDLSVTSGLGARSDSGAPRRIAYGVCRGQRSEQILRGRTAASSRAARPRAAASRTAKWWRSSGRQASARARCCTCSADSIVRTPVRFTWPIPTCARLSDGELVQFRNRNVGFVFQFHHLLAGVRRGGERRDADAHRASPARGGASRARRSCWRALGLASGSSIGRACCPAASSSESPSRGRW